ncbi:hypothetical protein MNV49_004738 [Pseudohyphozyma bogoriensis]|nr:hypothetical protein MNV49_004738 [Pseudohyphozyma bogoriensis]
MYPDGILGAIHGAGEAIRGTINEGLDGLGDGISQRQSGTTQSRTAGGEQGVARKGVEEVKESLNLMGADRGSTQTATSETGLGGRTV